MADKKKQPAVPNPTPVSLPAYVPIDYVGQANGMLDTLNKYADANIGKQSQAQGTLTRGAFDLTKEIAPQAAALRAGLNGAYSPVFTEQYLNLINQADPEFQNVRNKLGAQVGEGLDAGYSLGAGLERELEQNIRKGQTARGNWLGPAPTAAEAFGKASASIDLYNQRQQQANAYLNGRAPSDMFGQYSMMEGYQPVNVITPTGNYVDAGIPAQVAIADASNRNSYNNSLISAYSANNQQAEATYQNEWTKYLYNTAVSNGLYSTPSASGGGFQPNYGGAAMGALS